ncbi:MAG TPA: hydroxyphenylacetyl-CoA thioesterase PaaI [Thiolinea sp.]|nr:hydroxyphenylacetyl-CoA thioesterase PaaI [Thiolinea sp.]
MTETTLNLTPEQLALACSEAMHENDYATQALGMRILESTPGRALLSMVVRNDMLNGHAVCHGGFMFALADSAFAHACNNTNKATLASGCSIDFLASAQEGDLLTAEARERSRSGRTGVYDVEIHRQDGTLIAVFRGRSYQIRGSVLPEAVSPTEEKTA